MTIRAAADGSALGNPGPAGWAWYVDDDSWAAGGWAHATNNQAELTAVLQFFRATSHSSDDLLILCDSQYVINCVTKWMAGWKKKGWRKADGKPVLNVDLLKQIDAELVGRRYRFEWVKGHANHPLNEAADARARAVSESFQRGSAVPAGPGLVRTGEAPAVRPAPTELAPTDPAPPDIAPPDVAPTERAGVAVSPPEPLFDFAELDSGSQVEAVGSAVEVTLRLSSAEYERLRDRARRRGVDPTQLLRDLI